MLPSRRRWDTLTAATRGVSCSAIETTTWEYASRAAISGWDERARVSVTDASLLHDYILTSTNIWTPHPPRRNKPPQPPDGRDGPRFHHYPPASQSRRDRGALRAPDRTGNAALRQ